MRRFNLFLAVSALTLFGLGLYGCGAPSATDSGDQPETSANNGSGEHDDHAGHDDHADHGDGDAKSDMDKMKEELAKLSEEDRASAEKQHFCPVSDKMLGTMGAPIKVDVDGQNVWICCAGCKDTLLGEPEKHLAKLKK